jgi:histidine triad (HIT) family protein
MAEDCIFCKIVNGEIPCARVHETDGVLAFLDIQPISPGHALVIPKAHHGQLWDVPGALSEELFQALKTVGRAVMDATGAQGLNIGMNNYPAAGQLVMHAHFHLVPRFEGDGMELWPGKPYASMDDMNLLAEQIRNKIA